MPFSFAVLSLSEYIIHLRVENDEFSSNSAKPFIKQVAVANCKICDSHLFYFA